MAAPIRTKRKGSIERISKGVVQKGISVKDLVGTITLTDDAVEIQRHMRDGLVLDLFRL